MRRLRSLLADAWPSARALRRAAILGATAAAAFGVTSALASFGASVTGGPATYASKQIFPGSRTTSAWDLRDTSSGTESNQTSNLSTAGDLRYYATSSWPTAFDSVHYLDFDFSSPLPGGLSISGATFNFNMTTGSTSNPACFYIEVRRASTNTVLATYGSAGSPLSCPASTGFVATTTSIPIVTSSDIANDLRIRVYEKTSTSAATFTDLATVSGSTSAAPFTVNWKKYTDQSSGSPVATTWPLVAADSAQYTTVNNWATSFSSTRYLKFTFPGYVATSAVVTAATFTHSYKAATSGDNVCWYLEVYNGSTLIGTHGSSASPISCNSTTSFVTDNVSVPEVNTVTEANNVVVRVYVKDATGARKSIDDVDTLTLNYYVD
jgi:hypothetical protein